MTETSKYFQVVDFRRYWTSTWNCP